MMKERKVELTSAIVGAFVTLIVGFGVGTNWDILVAQFGPYFGVKKTAEISFDKELNEVYQQLATNFDGDLDRAEVVEEAKRGLVNAAGDKYTYYMNKKEAKTLDDDLNGKVGAGVGVEVGSRDGYVKVLRTTPDNPARRAGVLAGDIFYKVDGEDVSGLSSEEVAKRVRGEPGTEVKISFVRAGEEVEFTLTREVINNVSVYGEYKGDTLILMVTRFDSDTGNLVKEFAEDAVGRKVSKIVLDLRGNGGGYVSAAKDLLGFWLDGKLVVEQRSKSGFYNEETYTQRGRAILGKIKTVVLVNGATASAAEIVAGALRDYDVATVVGEKTFGKGSVQSLVNLSGSEMLRVTIAKWYTPKGANLNGDGIEPDKVVERSFDDINHERDPQMEAALGL